MHTQHQWLLSTLLDFYQNPEYLEILKQMVNREYKVNDNKKLSIRMVNWFVTNYAKQYFTVYDVPGETVNEPAKRFFVWTNYKSTEDSYSKQMFDPYCRKERILIPYKEEQRIETTIAQLHFFKWAILNKVLDYIVQHFDAIEKDMSSRLNTSRKKTDDITTGKTRKKREELSINACRSLRKEFLPTEVRLK
jgi:hypothetical protein|tara:strand:+ start:477 stop:1052 length:576 start_codon:yes stop_codon:yes gene_type:complete